MMELSRPLPLPVNAPTFSTDPAPGSVDVGVGLVVRMTFRAVNLVSIQRPTLPIYILAPLLATTFPADALSVTGANARVFRGEFMAMNAVGLFTPVAPTSSHILRVGHWLQMCGIHAQAYFARVVKLKTLGYGANEVLVDQSVCATGFPPPATTTVTGNTERPNPQPAAIRLSVRDMFCKELLERLGAAVKLRWHSGNSLFPGCRAGSVSSAYPPIHLTT
jgi:hypothetical protein